MRANNPRRAAASLIAGLVIGAVVATNGSSAAPTIQERVEEKVTILVYDAPSPTSRPEIHQIEQRPELSRPEIAEQTSSMKIVHEAKKKAEKVDKVKKEVEKAAEKRKEKVVEKPKVKVVKDEKFKKKLTKKEKAAKKAQESGGLPVQGAVVAATFGATGPWSRYHTGLDFRASYGKVVRAVAPGRVVYAGNKGNWAGNHIVVRHTDGKKTLYAHLSGISKRGGRVDAGTPIGFVGKSGRAFGSHLHLELYPEGVAPGDVYNAIDPRPWLRKRGVRLG